MVRVRTMMRKGMKEMRKDVGGYDDAFNSSSRSKRLCLLESTC